MGYSRGVSFSRKSNFSGSHRAVGYAGMLGGVSVSGFYGAVGYAGMLGGVRFPENLALSLSAVLSFGRNVVFEHEVK